MTGGCIRHRPRKRTVLKTAMYEIETIAGGEDMMSWFSSNANAGDFSLHCRAGDYAVNGTAWFRAGAIYQPSKDQLIRLVSIHGWMNRRHGELAQLENVRLKELIDDLRFNGWSSMYNANDLNTTEYWYPPNETGPNIIFNETVVGGWNPLSGARFQYGW